MNIIILNKKHQTGGEYIGRGGNSPLGNPFSTKKDSLAEFIVKTHDECIDLYEQWLNEQINNFNVKVIKELGRLITIEYNTGYLYLSCFCKPKRCHGDIIRKVLNERYKELIILNTWMFDIRFFTYDEDDKRTYYGYKNGYFLEYDVDIENFKHHEKIMYDKDKAYHMMNGQKNAWSVKWVN